MRLEVDPNAPGFAPLNGNVNQQNDQEKFTEYLNAGVKAAQGGDRKSARRHLMAALDIDSRSENAWLWLASISEYPEELLVFLNNVLDINPRNERALQWSASTKLLLSKTLVQRGIDAHENARRDFAIQCFDQALGYDAHNVTAWLWLAALCESEEKRLEYFDRVLEIDPENETARSAVDAAENGSRQALYGNAAWCAVNGDEVGAAEFVDQILARWPNDKESLVLRSHLSSSISDKRNAIMRLLSIDANDDYANACAASLHAIEDAAKSWTPAEPKPREVPKNTLVEASHSPAVVEFVPEAVVENSNHEESWPEDIQSNDVYMSDDYPTVDETVSVPVTVADEHVVFADDQSIGRVTGDLVAEVYEPVERPEFVGSDHADEGNNPFDSVAEPVMDHVPNVADERIKVLVVENNPTARKLMAGKLEKSGYNVICAESGREAVEFARTHKPALVLADLAMPGMDGYAICRTLRDNEETNHLPVVLISGKDAYYEEDLGQAAGANGFITKPFGPETLMKAVENFLATAPNS
jgi:CheY-like chemotaxis protein/tetratricopeptide (TPR) repeat protein